MRRFSIVLIVLCLLTGITIAQQETAVTAYERGDYGEAIRIYRETLAGGISNAALHTNLGHAYFQAGQTGQALVHYLTAQQFAPRDSTLQAQIARVRAERLNPVPAEGNWLIIMADTTRDLFTLTELGWLALGLWSAFFILLGVGLRWRDGRLRFTLYVVSGVLLVMLALFGTRLYVDMQQPVVVVTAERTQVMSGPGDDYLPLFTLFDAAEIRVLERRGEWLRFRLPDDRQGWLRAADVGYIARSLG